MKKMYFLPMTLMILATIPQMASAADDSSRFRLHLDTTFVSFSRMTFAEEGIDEPAEEVKSTNYGFGDNLLYNSQMFGVGMGFLLTDNLTIGSKVALGGGATEYKDDLFKYESRNFAYAFLPYLEFKFLTGVIQPFVSATVGYRGSVSWVKDEADQQTFTHLAEFGGAVGAHFFLAPHVSLDASITATGDIGKIVFKDDIESPEKGDIKGFQTAAVIGLSGWF